MVLIQNWPPHLALAPIAQMDPPCMPFRDAGYSQADYVLNIQDVVYGIWKAKEENLFALKDFNLEEYVYLRMDYFCKPTKTSCAGMKHLSE
jgi:cell division cycle 14